MREIKLHNLKIEQVYWISVECGDKPFEIRKNDRDYHAGDYVTFIVNGEPMDDLYKITYVSNYEQKEGYVVFGIKEMVKRV